MSILSTSEIDALVPWPCATESYPFDLSDGLDFGSFNPFFPGQQGGGDNRGNGGGNGNANNRGGGGMPRDFIPNPPAMNQGAGGPQMAANIARIQGLFRQVNAAVNEWALLDLFPVGTIIEWCGTKAALTAATSKWKIMDGTQGGSGQNRQGRFIRGSSGTGAVSGASTGGANSHAHGGYTGSAGAHSHNSATGANGSHDHGGATVGSDVSLDATNLSIAADCYATVQAVWGFDSCTETFGNHSHTIYADGDHCHSIDSEPDHCHSISSADNIPEYVETHWIEKVL